MVCNDVCLSLSCGSVVRVMRVVNERRWCNGYHGCLPSSRSGFDSRASQFSFPPYNRSVRWSDCRISTIDQNITQPNLFSTFSWSNDHVVRVQLAKSRPLPISSVRLRASQTATLVRLEDRVEVAAGSIVEVADRAFIVHAMINSESRCI